MLPPQLHRAAQERGGGRDIWTRLETFLAAYGYAVTGMPPAPA